MIEATSTGTLIAFFLLPGPKPPAEPVFVMGIRRPDHEAALTYNADGRLHLLIKTQIKTFEVVSCPLIMTGPNPCLILARWSLPEFMDLQINGKIVASTKDQVAFSSYEITGEFAAKFPSNRDFSVENAAVIKQRHQKFVGFQPIPNRERADEKYITAALKDEADQLEDLLNLLSNGKKHHAVGLAALLRRVIGEGKPLPLIQLHAALSDQPLIIFTNFNPTLVPKDIMQGAILFNISAGPEALNFNPIDLDVWLDTPAGRTSQDVFTHRQLIKAIGNTRGAHIDVNLHPYVTMLLSLGGNVEGIEASGLLHYITEVAKVVLFLATHNSR